MYVDGSIYANNPSLIGLTETFNGEKDLENIKSYQ